MSPSVLQTGNTDKLEVPCLRGAQWLPHPVMGMALIELLARLHFPNTREHQTIGLHLQNSSLVLFSPGRKLTYVP